MNTATTTSDALRAPALAAAPAQAPFTRLAPWLLLALLATLPWLLPALGLGYYLGFVRRLMVVMLAAMSLNFLIGQAGLVALGHAGFVGVGAYLVVAQVDAGATSAWLVWAVAVLGTAAVAGLIGAVSLRTQGVYFIMITLAFAQMLYFVAVSLRRYGGDDGYTLPSRPELGAGISSGDERALYGVVLLATVAVFWLLRRMAGSRFGHALAGIRDNETRMRALGYPVYALKLCAFVLAGGVAGLSGALLATQNGFVSPATMHWTQSATLIVMVVVGGVGRPWGAILGVGLWLTLEEVLRQHTEYWHWPLGLLLIAVVFAAPQGLAALRSRRAA